ncbi:MAG: B12-binding domain-containing radical SAM protein, partial [Desulfatitalea sp.]|nr:B12-binding domain-containing radical SAM protein [Desulfatitalea sp.]
MPDILLIQPPIEDFYLTLKRTVPYGLASIAAVLRRFGFSVAILDGLATSKARTIPWPDTMVHLAPYFGRFDGTPFCLFHQYRHFGYAIAHLAQQAKASGARLIGISSLFTAYSDTALHLAEAVKRVCPDAVIVMGGHHPTALPAAVMANNAVDYVLRGDGEASLPLLAQAVFAGEQPLDVPGLVHRTTSGALVVGAPAMVSDLNRLPPPAFDLIDWHHYQRHGFGSLAITAGRGCPLRCTYCAVNAATWHGYRRRDVASIIAELTEASGVIPVGFIDFEDEHLTVDRSWFMAMLSAIRQHFADQPPELRAMNGLLASTLDAEMMTAMCNSGFRTLNLALITSCRQQLARFRRPDITTDLPRIASLARSRGMNVVAYLIAAGPGQDPFASVRDLIFLAGLPVLAGVSIFYPAPGSADYEWCRRNGLLPSTFAQMRATALPLTHTCDHRQAATLLR